MILFTIAADSGTYVAVIVPNSHTPVGAGHTLALIAPEGRNVWHTANAGDYDAAQRMARKWVDKVEAAA